MIFLWGFVSALIGSDLLPQEAEAASNSFLVGSFEETAKEASCEKYSLSVRRCVSRYRDARLSVHPGIWGNALIHGIIHFGRDDIENGERHKWIGSIRYGQIYDIEHGYLFLPKSSFPPHIAFSKTCRSIRVWLSDEASETVAAVLLNEIEFGEIVVEYSIDYLTWHSIEPLLIQAPCYVESRMYKGKIQPYLGPLKNP